MPVLDLRTAIFITGVMGGFMSLVLLALRQSYPRSIQGLTQWALGPLLIFLSTLLFAGRDLLPDLLSVVAANMLLLSGIAVIGWGNFLFFQEAPRKGVPCTVLVCMAPMLTWFGLVEPNYTARLVTISAALAVLIGHQAMTFWRHRQPTLGFRFVMTLQGLLVTIMLMRSLSALFFTGEISLLNPTPIQSLYLTSHTVGMLLLMVGLILVASEKLRHELQVMVTHDMLTGILTRRALFDQGLVELARSQRQQTPLSALVLDLDHFKDINDQFGHFMGDRVLARFARQTQQLLRPSDHFGRFGGEEFLVLLPQTHLEQALTVAERIRQSRHEPSDLPPFTVSIGVATRPGSAEESLESLIDRADQALYQAKSAGRDCIRLAPETELPT